MATTIHANAEVHREAEIGEDVEIGSGVIVERDAHVGARTILHPRAFVGRGARIGEDVQVHIGAVVSHAPQDVKYDPESSTYCRIGAGSIIREYATIHRATTPDGTTVIGDRCFIMNYCHVGHDSVLGDDVILANMAGTAGHVIYEDKVYAAPSSMIHQFARVGRLAMLSAQAAVGMDVPPFHIAEGRNQLRGLNVVGMRRAGFSAETRAAIKEAHKILYRRGLALEEALDTIEADFDDEQVLHLVAFCRAAKRGLLRPKGGA